MGHASTLRIQETLLEPPAIPPPPTRHFLLSILIALAALLHVGTVGWADLYSQTEGQYAGAAKEMVQTQQWMVPTNDGIPRLQKPPLLYWLIICSFKLFGINTAAARLPIALAIVASATLIFLTGERLFDYWRGFIAGLIYLSFCGTFLLARIVMPEPIVSALITGAIYCGICGYQRRQYRRLWFAGVWTCCGLACLTKGIVGIAYPAAIFLLLALFYREARIRFRGLLRAKYFLIPAVIIAPWYIWVDRHFPGYFRYLFTEEWLCHLRGTYDPRHDFKGISPFQFLSMHLAWFFPWSVTLLVGIALAWRRVFRPREIEFSDALLFCWMAVVIVPLLFLGQRQDYYSMTAWAGVAIWMATAWDRLPAGLRLTGTILLGVVGIVVVGIGIALPVFMKPQTENWGVMDARWTALAAVHDMPASAWLSFRPMLLLTGASLIVMPLLAIYFVRNDRPKLAAVSITAAMLPIGLSMMSGVAHMAPYFSMAEIGRLLNAQSGEQKEVLFEGSGTDGSSLVFYLDQKFFLVNQNPEKENPFGKTSPSIFLDEDGVLEKWGSPETVYLVIEQPRISHWKQVLTERFHIFHQISTSGTYVVLSNQL